MTPRGGEAPLEGRAVLLVEDESLIVLDVTLSLEAGGARVRSAASVVRALDALTDFRPDVAVLDLKLAGGNTCEPIAARLAELGVPFLVHSGDALRHTALLERLGHPLVLQKPYPSHELARTLAGLLTDQPPPVRRSSAVR